MKIQALIGLLFLMTTLAKEKKSKTKLEEDEDEEITDEQYKLIEIDEININYYINKESHFLLLIHNPWCKFSQNLEKKLLNVNKLLKMEQQTSYIGSIDSTIRDYKKIILEKIPENVLTYRSSYPRLIYFKNGVAVELYLGKHNKNDIYSYIKRKIYLESVPLSILSTFESKITHDKNAFIYFGSNESSNFEYFNQLAKEKIEWMFYHTNEDKIYEKLNPSRNASVIYYTFGKKKDVFYNNQNMTQNFNKFLKKNTFVNYYEKTTEEFLNEVIMKKQSALVLFRNPYDNRTQILEENFELIAKAESSIKFLITDITEKYALKLARLVNVGIKDIPAIRIIDFKNGFRRFELSRELTMENVLNIIKSWKSNKLNHYLISQGLDVDQKKKVHVKRISTSTFHENVIFPKRNVIVLFYTNWCTHCKKV